jgi:hypothetical protein
MSEVFVAYSDLKSCEGETPSRQPAGRRRYGLHATRNP